MEKELFDELVAGLDEMVQIENGAVNENDTRTITPHFKVDSDSPIQEGGAYIASIRYDLGLSQAQFAVLLGVSTITVSSWEQGLRTPSGAVAKLITLIENEPSRINELIEIA
jgi:putative transcriptional regulator